MAGEYDAEAAVSRIVRDCAAYEQTAGLVLRVLSEVRAAHEAGRVEGAEEMRERAACEAGDALAERGYHLGGVVARVRALPTSPETLDAAGEVE
ncbi:hypothetical protein DRQ32_03325 [bacterium]|nr:MAG: hypothetical protein DRQ32_03325 [bacterium]